MHYANFGQRFAALLIDTVVLLIGAIAVGLAVAPLLAAVGLFNLISAHILADLYLMVVIWLYYAKMESSPLQATVGKLVLGLKVTDLNGQQISFKRATARYFGKFVSLLLAFIGFLMIAMTKNNQGLHDIMASCVVVHKNYAVDLDKPTPSADH